MNSNPQTKKIKIIKKTATVEPPTATIEPPAVEPETATVEPQTKENNKYDIMYKDFVFFSCGLYAKHRKKDGKLEKFPIFPAEWENLEKSIPVVKLLTGKVSNLTVIDYDNKELFERDKLLFPEILCKK